MVITVKPLLENCIEYVAKNLHMVDSFHGFPESVCENIFHKALSLSLFSLTKSPTYIADCLFLFSTSYKVAVNPVLDLSHSWKFVALCHDTLTILYAHIQTLKLSNCEIGDSHVVLQAVGHLCVLECLDLSNNYISDKGVINFLEYRRRSKKGLYELFYVNLSGNDKISDISLKHFKVLPKLKYIVFDKSFVPQLKYAFKPNCENYISHFNELNKTKPLGCKFWSDDLLNSWKTEFNLTERIKNQKRQTKLSEDNKRSVSLFYKKLKNVPVQKMPEKSNENQTGVLYCLFECINVLNVKVNNKRKYEEDIVKANNKKIKKTTNFKDDELLMQMYL